MNRALGNCWFITNGSIYIMVQTGHENKNSAEKKIFN